jgi:hypothetical protein
VPFSPNEDFVGDRFYLLWGDLWHEAVSFSLVWERSHIGWRLQIPILFVRIGERNRIIKEGEIST